MKSFTDVFPAPFGVAFEGGEFVAEFPEANRDAYIQNKKLNAWLACAKIHNDNYLAFNEYIMRLERRVAAVNDDNDYLHDCVEDLNEDLRKENFLRSRHCVELIDIAQDALNVAGKYNGGARIYVGADPKFAKQSLQSKLDQFKKIYKDK